MQAMSGLLQPLDQKQQHLPDRRRARSDWHVGCCCPALWLVLNLLSPNAAAAGTIEVQVGKAKEPKHIGITRAHLEEDAGGNGLQYLRLYLVICGGQQSLSYGLTSHTVPAHRYLSQAAFEIIYWPAGRLTNSGPVCLSRPVIH